MAIALKKMALTAITTQVNSRTQLRAPTYKYIKRKYNKQSIQKIENQTNLWSFYVLLFSFYFLSTQFVVVACHLAPNPIT